MKASNFLTVAFSAALFCSPALAADGPNPDGMRECTSKDYASVGRSKASIALALFKRDVAKDAYDLEQEHQARLEASFGQRNTEARQTTGLLSTVQGTFNESINKLLATAGKNFDKATTSAVKAKKKAMDDAAKAYTRAVSSYRAPKCKQLAPGTAGSA